MLWDSEPDIYPTGRVRPKSAGSCATWGVLMTAFTPCSSNYETNSSAGACTCWECSALNRNNGADFPRCFHVASRTISRLTQTHRLILFSLLVGISSIYPLPLLASQSAEILAASDSSTAFGNCSIIHRRFPSAFGLTLLSLQLAS